MSMMPDRPELKGTSQILQAFPCVLRKDGTVSSESGGDGSLDIMSRSYMMPSHKSSWWHDDTVLAKMNLVVQSY
jgi:hypothetical protein